MVLFSKSTINGVVREVLRAGGFIAFLTTHNCATGPSLYYALSVDACTSVAAITFDVIGHWTLDTTNTPTSSTTPPLTIPQTHWLLRTSPPLPLSKPRPPAARNHGHSLLEGDYVIAAGASSWSFCQCCRSKFIVSRLFCSSLTSGSFLLFCVANQENRWQEFSFINTIIIRTGCRSFSNTTKD